MVMKQGLLVKVTLEQQDQQQNSSNTISTRDSHRHTCISGYSLDINFKLFYSSKLLKGNVNGNFN